MEPIDYQAMQFAYRRCADQNADARPRHPVVVVGAGPVGLTAALDLARQGLPVVVLDDDCKLANGSRAICFAKRTLEIWDRLGLGHRVADKGVSWNVGRVFFRDQEVWRFDLLPEAGHRRPAFVNLQQYYAEGFLCERALADSRIDLRWQNKVTGVAQDDEGVMLRVATPEGEYSLRADWVLACDGSRSPVRKALGLETHGRVFRDRFLIADVRMQAPFPAERWFWFDPPFHPNQSVLLHMQPDGVWRVDFQLGWNADPEEAVKPENVLPRLRALLGEDARFDLEWVSVYTFACERMDHFRHGRVLFAGDSAHRVSPFGARGANSGVQDADNLAWKLRLVLADLAPDTLMDTYCAEREYAADENIRNSSRSTDFITPKSEASRILRNAVLNLAKRHAFARALVNSGRLSVPSTYVTSPLNTPDDADYAGRMCPGAVAADAPVRYLGQDAWWLSQLGDRFVLAIFCGSQTPGAAMRETAANLMRDPLPLAVVYVTDQARAEDEIADTHGLLAQRYDARPGTCYLFRPDQHVAARWRALDADAVCAALRRATGQGQTAPNQEAMTWH